MGLTNGFVRIKIKVGNKNKVIQKIMVYSTTITKKGQVTIPKYIRDALALEAGERVFFELEDKTREVRIKTYPNILELAGKFKVKKKNRMDPVKAREYMETHYERA